MQVHEQMPGNYEGLTVLLFLQILTALTMSNFAAVINIIASLSFIILNAYRLGKESGRIKSKSK